MQAANFLFRRELRGQIGLFLLAAAVMMFAAAALGLVLSLSHSFEVSLARQARAILGGDAAVRLTQREFSPEERAWIIANSARADEMRVARALAVTPQQSQVVRIKGVGEHYPLFGTLALAYDEGNAAGGNKLSELNSTADGSAGNAGSAPYPAYIGKNLAELLSLELGDVFTAGGISLQVKNLVLQEPDPDTRLWAAAPLVLVARSALEGERFMRPGALVSRHFRVALTANQAGLSGTSGTTKEATAAAEEWEARLHEAFPDAGWRVRLPGKSQGGLQRVAGRVRDFLALASLAAILLSGLGCGSALSAFLRARMRAIAVVKMLGGSAALIRRVYLQLAALFAVGGALAGAALGTLLMFLLTPLLSAVLPSPLEAVWSPTVFLQTMVAALGMTAAFAATPLLRFARINPVVLFAAESDEDRAPAAGWRERLVMLAAFAAVAAVLPLEWDKKLMLGGVALFALLLYALALIAGGGAARLAAASGLPLAWQLGLLAIARNRRQTAAAVMSLGVGVCVLLAILNTESNFSARIESTLRAQAPALYFMGISPQQHAPLDALIQTTGGEGASLRVAPIIRGRISALGGIAAKDIDAPPSEAWILRGDRMLTWTDGDYIGGSRVTQGKLWDENIRGLQASFDEEAALAFGLEIGDTMELNILGEPVTAVISSFREIEWQTLDINFAIILSDLPLPDLPYSFMGGAYLQQPQRLVPLQKEIYRALPSILSIDTTRVFDALQTLLLRAATLVQATALFLIFAGAPLIFAVLIENRRRRLAAAAALRLLGATRKTIFRAGLVEFTALALTAVIPASFLAAVCGYVIITEVFQLEWESRWPYLAAVAASSVLAFLALGAADIARAAKQSPFEFMRNS